MAIKCIALDLDGTTLHDDKGLSDRTRKAIESAIAKGVQVVIASGRCFDSLPSSVREIAGIHYAITSNGAAIYHMEEKACIRKYSIPEKAVERIIGLTSTMHCAFEAFYEGKAYAEAGYIADPCSYGVSEKSVAYIRSTRHCVTDIAAFMMEHKKELDSIDVLLTDQGNYQELANRLEQMKEEIYVTSALANRMEISSWEAGKHTGLQYILDLCGISRTEAAAFGDAENDVEMLQFVKYGMAVQNASKGCLDAAWKIVPGNNEDGVAEGIEELLLLP